MVLGFGLEDEGPADEEEEDDEAERRIAIKGDSSV